MDTAGDRQTAPAFTMEEGIEAVKDLSLNEPEDDKTNLDSANRRPPQGAGPRGFRTAAGARQVDFPLRILVSSEMVGAIIGRGGATIRTITQQSRARVDVHRKVDHMGSVEKAITVYGQPENCTTACQRICEVMAEEAKNVGKSEEISLKLLAHNNLIGRIIGKQGATIKRIMEDTDTKITVSSINDISSFNLERIITIKGTIPNMSRAEAEVSSKLRAAYETDLHAMAPQSVMFPGLHPAAMMSTVGLGINTGHRQAAPPQPQQQPRGPGAAAAVLPSETTYLYIPNTAVGAIIGTKGGHIRNIIKFSGSSVKIAPAEEGEEAAAASLPPPASGEPAQRKVTVVGPPESQWKAQYLIFEKLREEGFMSGQDDVRLTVEILVPAAQVGRIIGKGGQNVREMQRLTGAVIKLPEQGTAMGEETSVHIIGPFYSTQSAQRRIRAMVQQISQPGISQPPGSLVIPGLPAGIVLPGMPANGGSGGVTPNVAQPGPSMLQ